MIFLPSSIGGASFSAKSIKVIRLIKYGCANRPFFHISVMERHKEPTEQVIEQIGNYDPLPNQDNEKLVAINFQRLEYWLSQGAKVTLPVQNLLGLSGYFPIHYNTYRTAWNNRNKIEKHLIDLRAKVNEIQKSQDVSN
ncbi:mitochondrial 28S ribosomal protein S16, putative [Pediculus humanus corporis]|uniref:Small ribosomal subunit protein bS16m n=1 Tax=Pediculus humanus subsp. corporis TaxID=121224 RepID=E0VH53_PEDHC|nr:mitochondrial 28S ribosomal protein S16, putative [Pediculus humanus corporis]EEB12709.1 mitochondrial 28S ribosomal protein S16, putative [Pediculus humanus corporis]